MSRKSKAKRLKLPKRLLGVKLPKDARRSINDLLKLAPAPAARPLIAMAVGGVLTALVERLEKPLQEMLHGDQALGKGGEGGAGRHASRAPSAATH